MEDLSGLGSLLGIKAPWMLVDAKVQKTNLVIDVYIDFERGTKFPCPCCGVSAPLKASFIRKFHILNLPIQYLKHESTRTDVYIGWAMAGVRITKNKIL